MSDLDLKALREIAEKASPGPWEAKLGHDQGHLDAVFTRDLSGEPDNVGGWLAHGVIDPPGDLGLGNPTHWMPLPARPSEGPPHD